MDNEEKNIKVLIVDDSAIVRKVFTEELSKEKGIEVIGTAPDPYVARDKIVKLKPDVVTLDIEMPRMDGLTFLKKLMKYYPIPVIVVSSLTKNGSKLALEALSIGAVEVISKPSTSYSVGEMSVQLADKIRAVARIKVNSKPNSLEKKGVNRVLVHKYTGTIADRIIAIGSSTGGTEAIKTIITSMPKNSPPVLIVQHMPAQFTTSFAERLNSICEPEVKEAEDGEEVKAGKVIIAPGNFHMLLRKKSTNYYVQIKTGPLVHHQRPSVDVLFQSIAETAGSNAVGIILTGMGVDGALGLLKMRQAGARTIAQDEQSCVVFGMPREAIKIGAAEKIISINDIAHTALNII
ncbi:MAG: chemotaxis response regulator protein-glutamate methylesterase [Desulfobacterales bacterium]|nr:chemotaxis response regulator protein-glutamate methylesterase [Desulfobacterales bacterium]MBF0396625.1 chemotaxis response regulator protein-glutamate methylesterase [Desulfobacterales bacterium]